MKPELSEILIPVNKQQEKTYTQIITTQPYTSTKANSNFSLSKWFIVFVLFFTMSITIATTILVFRYEEKLNDYETRISLLEEELNNFFEHLESKGSSDYNVNNLNFDDGGEDEDGDSLEDNEVNMTTYSGPDGQLSIVDAVNPLTQDSEEFPTVETTESNEDEDEDDETRFVFGEMKNMENKDLTPDSVSLSRNKREIFIGPTLRSVSRSEDGVPILEGSYSSSTGSKPIFPNFGPTDSEGLRLYESLIATSGRGEPKSDQFEKSQGTNVQPYHRTSASWSSKDERNSRLHLKSGDLATSDEYDALYIYPGRNSQSQGQSSRSTIQTQQERSGGATGSGSGSSVVSHRASYVSSTSLGSESPNVFTRQSRIPYTGSGGDHVYERNPKTREYQYPPLQKLGRGEGEVIARVHQEDRQAGRAALSGTTEAPEQVYAAANHGESITSFAESRRYKGGFTRPNQPVESDNSSFRQQNNPQIRQRNRWNVGEGQSDEFSYVKAEAWAESPKTYAAHYVADVSNYTMAHRHYEGNGRLRNADGIFSDWKPSNWMMANEATKEAFSLSATGVLTVKKEGLYYIYAQIHYLDDHDMNGFLVQVNSDPFLQCTIMAETHSGSIAKSKSNTCFTGGITHLKENDRILLKDIETNRYSIFKPEKSFFGLMRIGNAAGR